MSHRFLLAALIGLVFAGAPLPIGAQSSQGAPVVSARPEARPTAPPEPRGREIDVLVVGDSQISFGAGAFYLQLFQEFDARCAQTNEQRVLADQLGARTTAAIGVRSSSLHSWAARDGRAKGTVCDVDPVFGVNAGVYGISRSRGRTYEQMGKGRNYQICRAGQSPFEAMFADRYYDPKLLILAFLGNSADRWARNPATAQRDLAATMAQIPPQTPCILLTTAPAYLREINDRRVIAQANLVRAHSDLGARCSIVTGLSPATRAAIEGQARFFTRNSVGEVTDPLHPKPGAFAEYFARTTPQICAAVFEQLER